MSTAESTLSDLGIETLRTGRGTVRRIKCAACGGLDERRYPSRTHPTQIIKHFANKGWQIKRRRQICPLCTHSHRPATLEKEPEMAVNGTSVVDREPTMVETINIARLLESHFDQEHGRYLNGYDDRRIAEELKLPMPVVVKVRCQGFGEIKANPELTALRDDLATVEGMVSEIRRRLEKLERDQGVGR